MRWRRGVIHLVAVLCLCHTILCDDVAQPELQLGNLVSESPYTVPFADYITDAELPAEQSLELASVSNRLCGTGFVDSSGEVNRTLLQDITELAVLNISTYYYIDVVKAVQSKAAAIYHVHESGARSEGILQATAPNLSAYDCIDLQMTLSVFRSAVMVDFGLTNKLWSFYQTQGLQNEGWKAGQFTTMNMQVAGAAVPFLRRMPIAPSASFNFTLQVMSAELLCCAVGDQSLLLSVMSSLLYNATDLISIRMSSATNYDPGGSTLGYPYLANFSFTASVSNYSSVPSLQTALQAILGIDSGSLFSEQMLNNSVDAVASAYDIVPYPGDSFSDQVQNYVATSKEDKKVPLGISIGVAVAGVAILAAAAMLTMITLHHRRQNNQQKRKLAQALPWTYAQSNAVPGLVIASYHPDSDSGSPGHPVKLTPIPISQWSQSDGLAAQPWDMDPAEIVICKRPDGSNWVLGEGSYGQVMKGLRGGVQNVALKMLIGETAHNVNSFRQEIEILKSLSFDRSIVQFYGTCPWHGQTILVLELMEGGDLRQAMTQAPAELHWYNKGCSVALDIIKGLHFLHRHMVVHMDVKPKNVLLTADYSIAKIADVGLAHMMGSVPGSQAMGTFAYAAPEQLLNQTCDEKVDIYSFGVLLWELVTTIPPIRARLRPVKVPAECPQEIADLIDHCLSMEPKSRPSARAVFDVISKVQLAQEQQAVQDPWDTQEGPPLLPSQESQPAFAPSASSLHQSDQLTGQSASELPVV